MNLQYRIQLLARLGEYLSENSDALQMEKARAEAENGWFVQVFIDEAIHNIVKYFLNRQDLEQWVGRYGLPENPAAVKTIGLVMAGNIPLVGFHDLLCCFIVGHKLIMKPSSKDSVLVKHLVGKLIEWEPLVAEMLVFSDQLRHCDVYIATGSNNSSRYFEFYFQKYPHIIRRNRSSVAVLTGQESPEELGRLAIDMLLYFGQGCRNVSKLYVPEGYNFEPLINALKGYNWMQDHHKLKNNYDYNLSLLLLNNTYYMTNGSVLLVENPAIFSALSVVHYEFYKAAPPAQLEQLYADEIQCVIGYGGLAFGQAQQPSLQDYADGVDTLAFLKQL